MMTDYDPGPLLNWLGTATGLWEGDYATQLHALAYDESEGPAHLVHLTAACEFAARRFGGGLPGPGYDGPVDQKLRLLLSATGGADAMAAIVGALRAQGIRKAVEVARDMPPELREAALDALLAYWGSPISGLLNIDYHDQHFTGGSG